MGKKVSPENPTSISERKNQNLESAIFRKHPNQMTTMSAKLDHSMPQLPQSLALLTLLLLLPSHFSHVRLCATPQMAVHQAPPSLGFSRQEHWSGLPFPSPCMKVKSESEVAQSCPTLSNPMDCSPSGSSAHGIFQARVLEWGAIAFSTANSGEVQKEEREEVAQDNMSWKGSNILHQKRVCNFMIITLDWPGLEV